MISIQLTNRDATARIGERIGALLAAGDVIAFEGDLGSGKTTLTQSIARGMGVTDPVTSPTFTLVQRYDGRLTMFHFDVYRLENISDIADIGLDEYFELGGVVVVEWADRLSHLLPAEHLTLKIDITDIPSNSESSNESEDENESEIVDDSPRLLTLLPSGRRYELLIEQLNADQSYIK